MLVISKNISNPFPQINGLAIGCVGLNTAHATTNYTNCSISGFSLKSYPLSQILSDFRQTVVCSPVGRKLSLSPFPSFQLLYNYSEELIK